MSLLLLAVAMVIFAIGAVMVAAERWSRTGFILEAVGAVIAAVAVVVQVM